MGRIVMAALLLLALSGCTNSPSQQAQPPHKFVVAYTTQPDCALVHIAVAKGFFAEEGVAVQPQMHSYGKAALKSVLEGKADLATAAETPVMFAALSGAKLFVVAGIFSTSDNNAVIGRRDLGISKPADLRGKRIGYTPGTTGEFFLESFLTANGLSRKEVTLVGLKPEEMVQALSSAQVAAVSTWNFPLALLRKGLAQNGATFFDRQIYTQTFNVVARQELVRKNPEAIEGVLRALIKAEKFAREHPEAAQSLVAAGIGIDRELLREVWGGFTFRVELDKRLLITLEDQTRWARKTGLAPAGEMPDYRSFIYADGLQAVKPDATTLSR